MKPSPASLAGPRAREPELFGALVWASRLAAAALLLTAWTRRASLDAIVAESWHWLRRQWWFQHDSFEPLVATAAFALWLQLFKALDDYLPLRRFLIHPGRVKDYNTGVPVRAGAVYLGVIMGYDVLYPRRVLPEAGPGSAAQVVWHVLLALWLYDLLFFPVHLAMHRVRWLRGLHTQHHHAKHLFSTEVLRHSLVDGSLQVGTNILVLNALGLHPMTRMLYNMAVTYWLTEIHSGYDLPWMAHNLVPGGLFAGPLRHEAHHASGTRHFQQFFTYLDDWLLPAFDARAAAIWPSGRKRGAALAA